jgi:hypothetical protein
MLNDVADVDFFTPTIRQRYLCKVGYQLNVGCIVNV